MSRFLTSGLDEEDIRDAMQTAFDRKLATADETFRYFCGVCWTKILKCVEEIPPQVER